MDPLTQASIGAAAAAIVCRKAETRHALLLGALAGAAPDMDVLIRSETDPLLSLQYHRHFTHALLIAPLIGLLVAALLKGLFFWKHYPYRRLALFGMMGAVTHGLIVPARAMAHCSIGRSAIIESLGTLSRLLIRSSPCHSFCLP